MPFVDAAHRLNPDENIPGDRCYVMFRYMKDQWNANRSWTTADSLYAWVVDHNQPNLDWQRAKELAWQVFFLKEVMSYEEEKILKNGYIY